jgi:adenylate cyclase
MKFTLRFTIMTALLAVLILTVSIVLISTYRRWTFTTKDLSDQVIQKTSDYVEERVQSLLHSAGSQSHLSAAVLRQMRGSLRLSHTDFPALTTYFYLVMQNHPELSFVSLGVERTGEYCHVQRQRNGALVMQECVRGPDGRIQKSQYQKTASGRVRTLYDPNWNYDPRTRPYYIAARAARRQIWTETYSFLDTQFGNRPRLVTGVTCATPLYAPDGRLAGVLSADFTLDDLTRFLRRITIGQSGFPFLVEMRGDGARKIIASGYVDGAEPTENGEEEAVAPNADRRLQAFLKRIPTGRISTAIQPVALNADGVSYLGSYSALKDKSAPRWVLCTLVPESELLGRVLSSFRTTAYLILIGTLSGILLSVLLANGIARPLRQMMRETERIRQLELEPRPMARSSIVEVDRLAGAMEQMKTGLRSFQKFVPIDYVHHLLASGQEARIGGERRRITLYFADIVNFTTLAEKLPPEETVSLLGEFLQALSQEIAATGGTVDKYNGDEIMAFWGAPVPRADHAAAACRAALRCQQALRDARARWSQQERAPIYARIGLHTGEGIVGTIGSEARYNYTVLGDTVNLAKRIEGLNKYYGTEIMLSEETHREAGEAFLTRPIDWVAVVGKREAVLIYELMRVQAEATPRLCELAELTSRALKHYRNRDWNRAILLYKEVLRLCPEDRPAQIFLTRCRAYREQPPDAAWNGVHEMAAK